MARNALFISYHFPPSAASGSFRLLGFAEHLPKHGWTPHVIAPPRMPLEPVDERLSSRVGAGAVVHHVPFPEKAPAVLKRIMGKSVWLPLAFKKAIQVVRSQRPDVILTSGPPHLVHLVGWLLRLLYGVPWIADFRDPWVSGEEKKTPGFKDRIWSLRLERIVFKGADRVIANAPNAERLYASAYPEAQDRLVVLTNGFDPRKDRAPRPGLSDVVHLLHAGEIYLGRNPLPLIDAIRSLNDENTALGPRLALKIIGRSEDFRREFADQLAERQLERCVQFEAQLPHEEILDEMEQAHINILLDTPGRKVGVPAKLYEYLGAGRPVLALAEKSSDTARVLMDSGIIHRVVPLEDFNGIRGALAELVSELHRLPVDEGGNDRLAAYTRESIAGSLCALFETLVSR